MPDLKHTDIISFNNYINSFSWSYIIDTSASLFIAWSSFIFILQQGIFFSLCHINDPDTPLIENPLYIPIIYILYFVPRNNYGILNVRLVNNFDIKLSLLNVNVKLICIMPLLNLLMSSPKLKLILQTY